MIISSMYKYKVERDQQQSTILTFQHQGNIIMVKCCRITQIYLHHPQNKLQLDFIVHQNHDHHTLWSALEHHLRTEFDHIACTQLIPTSALKCHIFVLSHDLFVESAIFNAVWLTFLLHGVPLKQSVFMHQWKEGQACGKAIYNIHEPSTPISGDYNSPPPPESVQSLKAYKHHLVEFLREEYSR